MIRIIIDLAREIRHARSGTLLNNDKKCYIICWLTSGRISSRKFHYVNFDQIYLWRPRIKYWNKLKCTLRYFVDLEVQPEKSWVYIAISQGSLLKNWRRASFDILVSTFCIGQNKNEIMDGSYQCIQQTNDARNNPRESSHQGRNQFRFEWFWTNANTFWFSLLWVSCKNNFDRLPQNDLHCVARGIAYNVRCDNVLRSLRGRNNA